MPLSPEQIQKYHDFADELDALASQKREEAQAESDEVESRGGESFQRSNRLYWQGGRAEDAATAIRDLLD